MYNMVMLQVAKQFPFMINFIEIINNQTIAKQTWKELILIDNSLQTNLVLL